MIMLNNKKDNEDNEFQTITRHGLTWLNIRNPDPQKIDALAEEYPNFHRLNLKDWLSNIQVPKIDTYADHIFIILYFPAVKKQNVGDKNTASEKEDIYEINQLCIFLGNRGYILTLHHDKLTSLAKMFQQYASDCENNGRSDDKNTIVERHNDSTSSINNKNRIH